MSEAAFAALLQRGLLLCLFAALPPLFVAGLCGGLIELLQGRLAVSEPAAPALARLFGGFATLLFLAPWLGREIGHFSSSLWALLPMLGQ